MPEWRLHNLRRTFASGLAALGVPVFICDKCLNHVPEDLKGVAKIYQKHEFGAQMANAWKLWGNHVLILAKDR